MKTPRYLFFKATVIATVLLLSLGLSLAQDMSYNEAPALADMVAAGELPPVEERLPAEPVVVEPLESIGEYGGAIRTGMFQGRGFQVRSAWGPEPILRIAPDSSTVVPNIAKDWEYTNDDKTFVLYLREGMKWSDGAPFNADNFDFWWNHIVLNEELSPSPPSQMVIEGELGVFEKVDDYTVQWTFSAPHANLPGFLAHAFGANIPTSLPSHYLQQFHADFIDEAELDQMVADAGFTTWVELFKNRSAANYGMPFEHVEHPTLLPFKLDRPLELNLLVAERNPYYWKVDPEGNQLPYIDQVILTNFESAEIRDAAIAAGELNWVNTDTAFTNFPLYQENAEANNYEVKLWKTSRSSEHGLMLNHTAKDPVLSEIFRDVRFKRALSLAMDRQTISDVVFLGFGVPAQVQVIPGSKFREEEWVTKDTEFDPDTANALLDEMGLERGSDGMRMRPDGEPLVLRFDIVIGDPGLQAVAELYKEFFEDVGVAVDLRISARDQVRSLIDNNDIEVGMWLADKGSDVMFPHSPIWHVPHQPSDWNQWGIEWTKWYASGGSEGEEPPADIKALQDLFDEMQITTDEDERIHIGKEILRLNAENLYNIGNVGEVPIPVIVGTNFKNYPEEGFTSFDWLGNHQYPIEQTYFEGGEWVGAP